jgi:hypothetical protein
MVAIAILIVVLVCAMVANRFGGEPERFAGAIIAVWVFADGAYHMASGPSTFNGVDPVEMALDGTELVAMVWLALRANRLWPLWAAAAQLICFSGHVVALIDLGGARRAYWAITQLPQYIQLAALLIGTATHARRERRFGPERSWRRA